MLFPNHPAYAEIRAGMGLSYEPGANALGYSAPYHGMGDFSPSMEQAALSDGIAQSDLDLLNELGATDQDLENLINGNVTLSQLYAQYGVTISPSSTATANSAGVTTQGPSPAAAGQIPSGSTLLYVASFQSFNITGADVIAAINKNLSSHGMSVISSQVTSTSALGTSPTVIQLTVLDSVGHALLTDAKSVLDSIANSASGGLASSNLSIVAYGAQSASSGVMPTTAVSTSPIAWLENNAIYIGIAIGALVFGSALIKRKW